jgi:c-di-GMP-binding flagellar brake protein YcgR
MNKIHKADRRGSIRLYVYHLVKYRLTSWPASRGLVLAFIKDISAGGAQLFTGESLPIGDTIQLYVNFPHLNQPIPCLAKITRAQKVEKKNKFLYGLQFMEIDEFLCKKIARGAELINKIAGERG